MVKVNNKDIRTMSITSFMINNENISHVFSTVSIVEFEQVNICEVYC